MNAKTYTTLWYISGAILIVVAVVLRLWVFPVVTADFTDSLTPWLNNLNGNPGFTAFKYSFSDYPPLYLYMLKFIAALPVNKLYAIKALSVVFDFIIAFSVYKICALIRKDFYNKAELFFIFSLALVIPTVLINSSMWAQCDSIYSAFVLGTFYFILRDKPGLVVVLFGLAFSLKLQSVFFAPFLLGYLWTKKGTWNYLAIIPLVYFVLLIPAWFSGGSFVTLLTKYLHQSGEYQALSLSAPSVFSYINESALSKNVQNVLSYGGILFTALLALGLAYVVYKLIKENKFNAEYATYIALASVLLVPFFLPHMHERYFYLADIFAFVFAVIKPRYFIVPVAVITASFFAYMPFLSKSVPALSNLIVPNMVLALIMSVAILAMLPYALEIARRNSLV